MNTQCEAVRRELEELMLSDECSVGATHHLRECGDCREFHQKQTRLRQIVGSLGTVEAPPDFDFRLRARLANESSSAGFHLRTVQWSFATKGFAAAAMVLLFVGGLVYVRTVNEQPKTEVAERADQPADQPAQPAPPKPVQETLTGDVQTPVVTLASNPRKTRTERRVQSRLKPFLATVDSAVERPFVISNSQPYSPIFSIDASLQSFKFSLDDGRTISVPTISFGSQRVLPTANQFAQKGVW